MNEIFDYEFYSRHFQKIKPKIGELAPLILRDYQKRFVKFWDEIDGPARIIVLKPRQAGFSTIVASRLCHRMGTSELFTGIAMADKAARTQEIAKIYRTFFDTLAPQLMPEIGRYNTEEIFFSKLQSGVLFETANDPNAGRSGTRKFAHWSETAFCRYAKEIDDGIQNSIPLHPSTAIIKESTANGRSGTGKYFYDLWNSAKRGESIYRPFFVAWYEIDDYAINPVDFEPTEYERDILKRYPSVTEANLMWRRLKVREYLNDGESELMTPEERFKQDFPLDDQEAFLSTGSPVFDNQKLNALINSLNNNMVKDIKDRLEIKGHLLNQFRGNLKIFTPPRQNGEYFIGADISEGLAIGDASSAFVLNKNYQQVASWHGKIDADLFGHLLIELAELYNDAIIAPEKNNMGHTTVTIIKNAGYGRLYKKVVEDQITKEITEQLGWVTTQKSKNEMLNEAIRVIRDDEIRIMDVRLAEELTSIARGENGNVELNGRDRTVAFCIALMARKNFASPIIVKSPPLKRITGTLEEINRAQKIDKQRNKEWF